MKEWSVESSRNKKGQPMVDGQPPVTVRSADGTTVAYWRSGEGRPLVLVHGTTADHSAWRPILGFLEPYVTVCAMDRRGRGGSGDADTYAIEREYDDVVAVVDAVAAETGGPVDVLGHSYGGLCALEAARLTSNIRRMALYEPVVLPAMAPSNPGFAERLERLLAQGRREQVLETFYRELLGMTEEQVALIRTLPDWQARIAAAHTLPREDRAEHDYRFDPSRFASVSVPVLLLRGSESPPFFQASTDAVADALPDVRIVTLEGQQHVATRTAPRLVADALLTFLTES